MSRAMQGALALGLGLALIAGPAAADEAESLALARRIIDTRSHEAEMQYFDASLPYYLNAIEQSVRLTDAERLSVIQYLREEYEAALVLAREHRAATYARLFKQDELREMLDFYQSGAGRRYLENEIELDRDSIAMQDAMNAAVLQAAAERLMAAREAERQF